MVVKASASITLTRVDDGENGADGQMLYATCGTAASTKAKVATLSSGSLALRSGVSVAVKFTYANSVSSPTLNINSTGAKTIRVNGSAMTSSAYYWGANAIVTFVYDGSYWNVADAGALSKAADAQASIEALADSISLSVTNGALGSKASVELRVNGKESTAEIDMTKARQAFANDTSSVAISGGRVTFNAGTLLINAGNFTLDSSGTMTASNGTFTGTINATTGTIAGVTISSGRDYATHAYSSSIFTQFTVDETLYLADADNTTTTLPVDTEVGFKKLSAPGERAFYMVKKPSSVKTWAQSGTGTNTVAPFYVNGRGRLLCSGIEVYLNYAYRATSDGELMFDDSTAAAIRTDSRYLYLDYVKFLAYAIHSDFDPAASNTYDMGGTSYYWKNLYCAGVKNQSDRKVKQNILPLAGDYKRFVMSLEPVEYDFKDSDGHRKHLGFIAQDVAAAAQATVGDLALFGADVVEGKESKPFAEGTPDEKLSWFLNYTELIAPLVATVQAQERRMERLEQRLNVLERHLNQAAREVEE